MATTPNPWEADPISASPEATVPAAPPPEQGDMPWDRDVSAEPMGWGEYFTSAGKSFKRGVQLGQPIGKGGGLTPENIARAKQGTKDPALRQRGYLTPEEFKSEQKRRAGIQQEQTSDVERGGGWLSSLSETVGEFAGDPRMYLGNAASKAVAPIAGLAAREVGGAVGQRIAGSQAGTAVRDFARAPPTLPEARKSDVVSRRYGEGTAGMRESTPMRPLVQAVEKASAALPGGGRIVKAATEMQSERSRVVSDIVRNLTRGKQIITGGAEYPFEKPFKDWRRLRPYEQELVRTVVPDVSRGMSPETARVAREAGMTRLFGYVKESYDRPREAMRILDPLTKYMGQGDTQLLAGHMLDRMGTTALDGSRAPFTLENFLRNWDGMHPAVRDQLFGWEALGGEGIGTGYARNVQTIVDSIKDLQGYSNMAARAKVGYKGSGGGFEHFPGRPVLRGTEGFGLVYGFYQYALYQNPGLLKAIAAVHGTNAMIALAATNPDVTAWVARQMVRYAAQVKAHYRQFGDDTQFLDELNRVPQ